MGLLSLFRKNKQETASGGSEFSTRAEDESNEMRGRSKRKPRKQANEPVDPVLPQKKRARRRLVGAVALVVAAVITLPMMLDSEPKPLADDIAIQIPSMDQPAVRAASDPVPSPLPMSAVPASAGLDKDEELIEPSAPQKSASNLSPAPVAAIKPEQPSKPVSKVEDKMAVQSIPVRKTDESERARAILEGRGPGKAQSVTGTAEVPAGAYVVQVAALASPEKVTELQSRLKTAGIKSHTQKVATANGERIRVRVGPFANKDEADRMREKLVKLGLNGTLVPT